MVKDLPHNTAPMQAAGLVLKTPALISQKVLTSSPSCFQLIIFPFVTHARDPERLIEYLVAESKAMPRAKVNLRCCRFQSTGARWVTSYSSPSSSSSSLEKKAIDRGEADWCRGNSDEEVDGKQQAAEGRRACGCLADRLAV